MTMPYEPRTTTAAARIALVAALALGLAVSAAAEETASPEAAPPAKMTVEQIKAAMAEAETRRLEQQRPDPAVPTDLVERWGVEVIGISRTAGGYMLDFRFRVVDDQKALPLFDHRIKPYVKAERSGINLPVPVAAKVGAFRPTNRGKNIKDDKTYYMVFGNPDSHVKPGEKVSVVIGDFRVENLTVR
jgi:hypothetical protein